MTRTQRRRVKRYFADQALDEDKIAEAVSYVFSPAAHDQVLGGVTKAIRAECEDETWIRSQDPGS